MRGNMPGWTVLNIQTNLTAISNDFEQKKFEYKESL